MVEYAGGYSADSTGPFGDPVKHVENGRRTNRHGPVSLPVVAGLMRGIDAFVMLVAAAISYPPYLGPIGDMLGQYIVVALIGLLLQINLFHMAGLYELDCLRRPIRQVWRMGAAWSLLFFLLVTLGFLTKTSAEFSRGWVLIWFVSGFTGLAAVRFFLTTRFALWRREGRLNRNVVVVGAGEQASRLIRYLEDDVETNKKIVGVFDDRADRVPEVIEGHAITGTTDDLIEFARKTQVDEVLVALPWTAEDRLLDLFKKFRTLPVDVRLGPDLIGFRLPQCSFDKLDRVPIVNVAHKPFTDWKLLTKGVEDRVLAALILVFILPLFLSICALVKMTSPGPVFFRQQRFGFNHQPFEFYKFRSMYHDQCDPDAEYQTTKEDSRVTPLGRFLRRSSLDELPQFINVLRGEMSIVGPRPHPPSTKAAGRLFDEVVQEYAARHRVKPGITGWAQINGWRGETETEEKILKRVEHDLYYIENWSIGFDLKILLITPFVVLRGKNAY